MGAKAGGWIWCHVCFERRAMAGRVVCRACRTSAELERDEQERREIAEKWPALAG